MQGIIFNVLGELVEETWGMETWNSLLEKVDPESQGAYTAGMQYPDNELLSLVAELSEVTKTPVPDLVEAFGTYLFPHLMRHCPIEIADHSTVLDFLDGLNDVIHAEVLRVHPDAYVPHFDIVRDGDDKMSLVYHSKRGLCPLCIGLFKGAAGNFDSQLTIDHPQCKHKGDENCVFDLAIQH